MKQGSFPVSRLSPLLCGLLLFASAPPRVEAQPQPAVVSAFDAYARAVEARLARQHGSMEAFLAPVAPASGVSASAARLRGGELVVEQILPPSGSDLPGALLHHWRGTAFVPGATVADFERLLKDFAGYPRYFAPQVLKAGATARPDGSLEAWMRVRQRHVLTVVMDTNYDVSLQRLDARHGSSISRSTKVAEIDSPGTSSEHALNPDDDHGFLWRLNTYWSYEERNGGLYMQIESVSLTRSIPPGLGWAVKPFVESVPRESLEFTLLSAAKALRP